MLIAPGSAATASVTENFRQVAKQGDLRMHPIVGRLVDKETPEKMGATRGAAGGDN